MTILLTSAASARDALLEVDNPTEASLDDVLKIDSELVVVRGRPSDGAKLLVGRGFLGSARATHAEGAELTQFALEDVGAIDSFPPSQWSVAADGGLTIQPNAEGVRALTIKENGGGLVAVLGETVGFPAAPLVVDSVSAVAISLLNQTGANFSVRSFGGYGLDVANDGAVTTNPDPGAGYGFAIIAPADNPPFRLMYVQDAAGDTIFRVDSDGSVHIKTGTTIVADL